MSALLEWGQTNPKKAAIFSLIAARIGYSKLKSLLATPKSLKGQIVVITGGACGLGNLLALKCYDEGSTVIIWDVNKAALEKCQKIQPNANGGRIEAYFVDVCDVAKVNAAAESILSQHGRVDILIQNAGVVAGRPLLELSEKDIRRTFDVNVISQFWTLRAFLPSMIARKKGHIVSIVSTAALASLPFLTDYCASKSAARSLDEGLKRELMDLGKDEGIVFTGIYPGFMNTGMFEGAVYHNYLGSVLLSGRKMIEPEEVAMETMEAIKYEKREVTLPKALGHFLYVGQLLPFWFKDDIAIKTNSMKEFYGGQNRLASKL